MPPISIYIHWPFCLSLCPYCDFNSHISSSIDHELWLSSYKKEINHFKDKIEGRKIQSIFFGGGTPSLMNPRVVEGVIQELSNIGILSSDTEITLEANPTSYETEKFKEFKEAGINRVSIGVQSLQADALKMLGREHSAKEAIAAISSAANIFNRFSFDLIYAIPGQTLNNWQKELQSAMDLAGGHISLYQLTIEKGTPFYQIFKQGHMQLPSNDESANMYEWTNDYLKNQNYNGYEISNYAKPGHECRHNLAYWNYDEYLGIGPGAHSRLHSSDGVQAVMMTHKPAKWLQNVAEIGHSIQTNPLLSQEEVIEEVVMMGTRLRKGMSLAGFQNITGQDFDTILQEKPFLHYKKSDLVFKTDTHFGLTDSGLLLHNYLIPRLI